MTQSTAGPLSPATRTINANSLYDCDTSVGTHQPYYFDQLCASSLYTKYLVYATRAVLKISVSSPTEFLIRPTNLSTAIQSMTLEDERPGTISKFCIPNAPPTEIVVYMDHAKTLGYSKTKYASEDNCAGPYNNNPATVTFLQMACMNTNIADTTTAYVNYELTFYCKFFDRKPSGQS